MAGCRPNSLALADETHQTQSLQMGTDLEGFEVLRQKFDSNQRKREEREFLKRLRLAEVRAEAAEEDARHAQEMVRQAMEYAQTANEKAKLAETQAKDAEKRATEAENRTTNAVIHAIEAETRATEAETKLNEMKAATARGATVWDVAALKAKVQEILKTEDADISTAAKTACSVGVQTADENEQSEIMLEQSTAAKLKLEEDLRKQAEEKAKSEEYLRKQAEEKVKLEVGLRKQAEKNVNLEADLRIQAEIRKQCLETEMRNITEWRDTYREQSQLINDLEERSQILEKIAMEHAAWRVPARRF